MLEKYGGYYIAYPGELTAIPSRVNDDRVQRIDTRDPTLSRKAYGGYRQCPVAKYKVRIKVPGLVVRHLLRDC